MKRRYVNILDISHHHVRVCVPAEVEADNISECMIIRGTGGFSSLTISSRELLRLAQLQGVRG